MATVRIVGAKAEGKYCSVCGTPIEVEKHTSSSANNYKSPYVMEISSKAPASRRIIRGRMWPIIL